VTVRIREYFPASFLAEVTGAIPSTVDPTRVAAFVRSGKPARVVKEPRERFRR
jgi:hypothetical protein